jgi:hypothetical protein
MADSAAVQPKRVSDKKGEESERMAEAEIVSDANMAVHRQKMSDSKSGTTVNMSDMNEATRETTVPPPAMPPCATTTYVLGTRCAPGHTWASLPSKKACGDKFFGTSEFAASISSLLAQLSIARQSPPL